MTCINYIIDIFCFVYCFKMYTINGPTGLNTFSLVNGRLDTFLERN